MKKANENLLNEFRRISMQIKMRHHQTPHRYRDEEDVLMRFCANYLNQITRRKYFHLPISVRAEKTLAFFGANSLYKLVMNNSLNATQAVVLKLRYGSEMFKRKTMKEVAEILGYNSRERIHQIEAKALRKLSHCHEKTFHEKENEYLMNKFREARLEYKRKRGHQCHL